jgi:neutral trehalase
LSSVAELLEKDFAKYNRDKGETTKAAVWERRATSRAKQVDKLLWGRNRHFYFDYNFS